MSFTLIPGRHRGKHNPDAVIGQLRAENVALLNRQAAADEFFAVLLADVNDTNRALRKEQERRRQAEQGLAEAWGYIRELEAELAPHRAAAANAHKVTVPPMVRDTSAIEDQATAPIDVTTLREASAAGRLSPITRVSTSGTTAGPGQPRQTTWGRDVDDTQPLPKVSAA